MVATVRYFPVALVAAGWALHRSLGIAAHVGRAPERLLGGALVVLLAVTLLVEARRAAAPGLARVLAGWRGRAAFAGLAAAFAGAYAFAAGLVAPAPPGAPGGLVTGTGFGPLTVWPHVAFTAPALGLMGHVTLGRLLLLAATAPVFAAAVLLARERARGACAVTGAPVLAAGLCAACGAPVAGAALAAAPALNAVLPGNPASPLLAAVEAGSVLLALWALARVAGARAEPAPAFAGSLMRRALPVTAVALTLTAAPLAHALAGMPPGASTSQEAIHGLFVIVTWVAIALTLIVFALLIVLVVRDRHAGAHEEVDTVTMRPTTRRAVAAAYIIVPAIAIFGLGALSYQVLAVIDTPPDGTIHVDVQGAQFVWAFTYPDGSRNVNELRVQVNEVVRLNMTSADVIHSFWVPDLGVKMDTIPGTVNEHWFRATVPGTYRAYCAEFCGAGHAQMIGQVVVFPEGEQARPYGSP